MIIPNGRHRYSRPFCITVVLLAVMAALVVFSTAGCAKTNSSSTHSADKTKVSKKIAPKPTAKKVKVQKQGKPKESGHAAFQQTKLIWADPKGRSLFNATCKTLNVKSEKEGVAEMNNVTARLYKNGVLVSVLTAPHVVAWNSTRKISADGGVSIKSKTTGATYYSDSLVWDSKKDLITGTGKVRMVKKNMSVNADKFTSDTALENANFREGKHNGK